MRIASLPMYDAAPEAVDAWWHAIARALHAQGVAGVPAFLDRPAELDAHWRDPRLLLSQTCGYPLVTTLLPTVQVVGAFHYTAPGCSGVDYRSELLARIDDAQGIEGYRGRVAAINAPDSHSGCNALRAHVAPLASDAAFFGGQLISGSHRGSLAALGSGAADIAAIDCVSLAGFRRHDPALLDGLRTVGSTAPAPGLPLITSGTTSLAELAALRKALHAACSDAAAADAREALFIGGFQELSAGAWQAIDDVRKAAIDLARARAGTPRGQPAPSPRLSQRV
ncbi:MAG: PhnD/SsuA/transferrin family substrate-binding protein [Betaproteobacteria bacterium]